MARAYGPGPGKSPDLGAGIEQTAGMPETPPPTDLAALLALAADHGLDLVGDTLTT
jgi:hypothetical protein